MLKTARTYLFVLLAMMFWGFSFVWFRQVVIFYEPITIITLRLFISGTILISLLFILKKWQPIEKKDIKWFLALAFTQPFCYFLGESFGLKQVSPTISSAIIATIPVITPIAAWFFIREKPGLKVWLGIFISSAGIALMLFNRDLSLNAAPQGVALLFFAVISAIAYTIIIRKIADKYNALLIIAMQNIIGGFYFLPLFFTFDFGHFLVAKPDSSAITALILLSVFASTFAYYFYIISIREIGVTKANIFTNLIPVFTATLSYFVLNEQFTLAKIAGMTLVIAGVVIVQQVHQFQKQKNQNI